MKERVRPAVLSVNGKAEPVVQDASSYQETLDRLEKLEFADAVCLGVAAAKSGPVETSRKTFPALVEKLGIRGRYLGFGFE